MVIDTSAGLAVLSGKPAAEARAFSMAEAPILLISAASQQEAGLVAGESGVGAASDPVDRHYQALDTEMVPIERGHLIWALQRWREFGKGRHPAGLNLGDCFSGRLAGVLNMPLLDKGDDVIHTDVLSIAPHR